ncbi:cobalt ECF transporter T component CbiQ [Pseudalkalibacillus decolorationis]|uniref:cobalt ECF transporter T component CbiQ n=1 Tax=Pseudalkalibacillus decolorationis TaxID=163879 RepID=UPI002148F0A3|nr:cobalt ECF transporter T component CbiQ [Pseudalkalibacillus decolorationis]
MILIDSLAYQNRLRGIHPIEKFLFSIGTLLILVATRNPISAITVLAAMSLLIVLVVKIPFLYYLKILMYPFTFLLLGALPIIITISPQLHLVGNVLWFADVGHLRFMILTESLERALHLVIVSISSVSCLYFLLFTTPMNEILYLLSKWKVPSLLLELIAFSYRYLFLLLESAYEIHRSQQSRLGYQRLSNSLKSLGTLATMLFIQSFNRAKALSMAMDSRGGELSSFQLTTNYKLNLLHIIMIAIYGMSLFFMSLAIGGSY